MKTLTVVLFAAVASVSGFLIKVPTAPTQPRPVSSGWVHLQKLLLPLFENVCEESTDPTIIRLAQESNLDPSSGIYYLKPDVVKNLQDRISGEGLMKKGEIFSEYNVDNLKELRAVFEVLYYAKDFSTFYRAAAWARQNINCGLFVDVIYMTVLYRRDTANLTLPPPYELLPNYFITKPFIYKASRLLSGNELPLDDTARGDGNSYIIDANYTNDDTNDDESALAYFREDIGLNSYYFLQKLKKCPWIQENSDINNRHGEFLYHMMQQLAARYSLEKYSHGLSDIDNISWDSFVVPAYDPMLTYSTGDNFGYRITPLDVSDNADVQLLQSIESNIATVVTHLRDTGYNKTQIINHLMEILLTSDKNFEIMAQKLVGKDIDISSPSVLDHYMTTLRDPFFWRLNKLVVNIIDNALKALPTYTRSELYFPGLELVSIEVNKISTYFDYFQFDVTDALKSTITTTFQVKISQPRLNHKPFTVKLKVNSLVAQKGLIKIFIGPKTPPGDFVAYKNMFVLLDSFEYSFKKGINAISRTSDEMANLSDDFTSRKYLRKNIADAEFGLNSLPLKGIQSMLGFPSRLIIPKGTENGLPLQIFVLIVPFGKISPRSMLISPDMEFNSVVLSPGFPFDLGITDAQLFQLPNALIKDVLVTHKGDKTIDNGGTSDIKNWQQRTIRGTGQDYTGKKNKPFDYNAKKAQYGRKKDFDYTAKRGDYSKYKNQEFRTTTDSIDTGDVVTYINKNIVDQTKIRDDITIGKDNFNKDIILNSDKKKVDFDMYDADYDKMIGKVDLNKSTLYDITDIENSVPKYTKSVLDSDDSKMVEKADIYKDVNIDTEKNIVDFDKEVNIPTHKYTKDITNVENNSIDKVDLDKEVTVHDTDNNKVDIDKIFPIYREGKDVNFVQDGKLDSTKRNIEEFFVLDSVEDDYKNPFLGPTRPKYRKPSIYNYLVHPNYDDDYSDEKVFE